jgi:hypothetical protein
MSILKRELQENGGDVGLAIATLNGKEGVVATIDASEVKRVLDQAAVEDNRFLAEIAELRLKGSSY